MTALQNQVNELRVAIDRVTHQIHIKINQKDYSELAAMLSVRWDLLHRLTAIPQEEIDRSALQEYLIGLRDRDQYVIKLIGKERSEIEAQLINLSKISSYVNPAVRGVY